MHKLSEELESSAAAHDECLIRRDNSRYTMEQSSKDNRRFQGRACGEGRGLFLMFIHLFFVKACVRVCLMAVRKTLQH